MEKHKKVRSVPRHLYTDKPYKKVFQNHAAVRAELEAEEMAEHIILDGERMAVQYNGTVASINIIHHMVGGVHRYGGILYYYKNVDNAKVKYAINKGQWVLKEGENISIVDEVNMKV